MCTTSLWTTPRLLPLVCVHAITARTTFSLTSPHLTSPHPTALSDAQVSDILSSDSFLAFFSRTSRIVERALHDNYDVAVDYTYNDTDAETYECVN